VLIIEGKGRRNDNKIEVKCGKTGLDKIINAFRADIEIHKNISILKFQ
jgi:hypothetical protein